MSADPATRFSTFINNHPTGYGEPLGRTGICAECHKNAPLVNAISEAVCSGCFALIRAAEYHKTKPSVLHKHLRQMSYSAAW